MKISFGWGKKKLPSVTFEECLSRDEADKLQGQDIDQIVGMPRADRMKLFTALLGEQKAAFVNRRLEIDVILPRQKAGLMAWINAAQDVKPKWREEVIREISALDRAMDQAEQDEFFEHLAKLSLGAAVTLDETKVIVDLSNAAKAAKAKMEAGGSVEEFEKALQELNDYVDKLKSESR